MQIGVIGLGQMGRGIAANLAKAGYLAAGWDVVEAARTNSGQPMLPPAEMAARVEAVVFVVPSSKEIAALLDEMLPVARPGLVLLDLTTSHPSATKALAARAEAAGCVYLDAGMSGGGMGADAGTLTLMMGGDRGSYDRMLPALRSFARAIFHLGAVGAGHTMKLVHNMVCHTNFLALAEAGRMAQAAGLSLPETISVISAGNARSYISEQRFPNHILSGRFDGRSTVSNLAKDLNMAADLAGELGLAAPYTRLTTGLLNEAMAEGKAGDDFTTLYQSYDEIAAIVAQG